MVPLKYITDITMETMKFKKDFLKEIRENGMRELKSSKMIGSRQLSDLTWWESSLTWWILMNKSSIICSLIEKLNNYFLIVQINIH